MNDVVPMTIRGDEFPEHLSFEVLRREAIAHLGELSGHIWTDHNVHDPGITIMELLIFSLMDLGYRSQLPIQDLIAPDPDIKTEQDNFFSPAQILSNNPTTILDFRKMLIDLPHVRNAWLEKASAEIPLYPNSGDGSHGRDDESQPVGLNGLYKVLIQLEPGFALDTEDGEWLLDRIKDRLQAHRNLGEDYTEICFLCECKITFCIDVAINEEANPSEVYVQITTALQDYLSPPIPFYTLQELLDQGLPIEEVFEGRPYGLESHGFIKSTDLGKARRVEEIHISDLYKIVSDIADVLHINTLKVSPCHEIETQACDPWIIRLPRDHVPVFCADSSTVQLKKNHIVVSTDAAKIDRFRSQAAKVYRKAGLQPREALDKEPPAGRYRADLGAYYSIQNDLPRVYGVREGGLPANATTLRRAQAKQLRGFLLFFDRLFIGYLHQLSQVGKMFSLDPVMRRSVLRADHYIDYAASDIPGVDQLIKFYRSSEDLPPSQTAKTLAYPVELRLWQPVKEALETDPKVEFHLPSFDFQSIESRSIMIQQFRREFSQREYDIAVCGYPCHNVFAVTTQYSQVALISRQLYDSKEEAHLAADRLVLLGTLTESYQIIKAPNYTFEVVDDPSLYAKLAQELVASPADLADRQGRFLDHLLARFNEEFADYSLILYDQRRSASTDFFERKAAFLSQYDRLSRNRGKAFDYSKPYWQQDNMSGFKAQVMARLGKQQMVNERACNFEVDDLGPEYQIVLRDPDNVLALVSTRRFKSPEDGHSALLAFIDSYNEEQNIKRHDDPANGHFSYELVTPQLTLISARSFSTAKDRDADVLVRQAIFQTKSYDHNIFITGYQHYLELGDHAGDIVRRSKRSYASEHLAKGKLRSFIHRLNREDKVARPDAKLSLVPDPRDAHQFMDRAGLEPYFVYEDFRYRWVVSDVGNLVQLKSHESYVSGQEAGQALAEILQHFSSYKLELNTENDQAYILLSNDTGEIASTNILSPDQAAEKLDVLTQIFDDNHDYQGILQQKNRAYAWHVLDEKDNVILSGSRLSTNKRKAERDWRQTKADKKSTLEIISTGGGRSHIVHYDRAGSILAQSPEIPSERAEDIRKLIQERLPVKQHIQFHFLSEAYGYRILDSEEPQVVLLESYDAFRTPGEALDALSRTLDQMKKTVDYYPTGDEANLNYSFSVQDKQGRFVMTHPSTHATVAERDLVMQRTQEEIEELRLPLLLRKESPFWLKDGPNRWLRSTHSFETRIEALDGMCLLMLRLRDDASRRMSKEGKRYVLSIYDQDQCLAYSPPGDEDYLRTSVEDQLKSLADAHFYQATVTAVPHSWAYRMYWKNAAGMVEEFISSEDEFASELQAEKGYQILLDNIHRVRPKHDVTKNTLHFHYGRSRKPFGQYPHEVQEPAASDLLTDVQNYLDGRINFRKLYDQQDLRSWVDRTPESKQGNYIYRLVKNHDPIAFAPCDCITKKDIIEGEDTGQTQNPEARLQPYREKWMGSYFYCDFCLAGDVVIKIGIRYHFVFREIGTNKVYLVSAQSYVSREEAERAFFTEFFNLLDLASDPDEYGTRIHLGEIHQNGNGHCQDSLDPVAYVPREYLQGFDRFAWARCFCSYPIRRCQVAEQKDPTESNCRDKKVKYQYYFHLLKPEPGQNDDCKVAWKSTGCFDTAEEARAAFHRFQYALKNAENYYLYFDENGRLNRLVHKCCAQDHSDTQACCTYPAIREVLVNSRCRYRSADQAWGRSDALAVFDTRHPTLALAHQELLHFQSCRDDVGGDLQPSVRKSERDGHYTLTFYHGNRMLMSGTKEYTSREEADSDMREILSLFPDQNNYHILRDRDCWYRLGIGRKKCPPPVCERTAKEAFLQPKGLQELFATAGADTAYYRYARPEDGHYTFHVVGQDFHLARHPFSYDTLEERNSKMLELYQTCPHDQYTPWQIDAIEEEDRFVGVIQNASGQELVRSLASFEVRADAVHEVFNVVDYLRDKHFYVPASDGSLALSKLRNDHANSPEKLLAKIVLPGQTIEDWAEQALLYPLVKREEGIGFQHYCPDFEVIDEDDEFKYDPCIQPKPPSYRHGAVVWTSEQTYGSAAEALCHYLHFLQLLEDRANYRPTQDSCGTLGIELVDPRAIIASHPQAYHLRAEVEQAIIRTQDCLYTEGLHVVEHILLRPRKKQQENEKICYLPSAPSPDCRLPYESDEDATTATQRPALPTCPPQASDDSPKDSPDCEELRTASYYTPGHDPYSFLATLVLPAYAPQFRSLTAREWFQNLLYESAPLHLGLNILWLDPKDMCLFEAGYNQWLLEQRCANHCSDTFSLCDFIRCFTSLHNCPALPEATEEESCTQTIGQTVAISPFGWQSMFHQRPASLHSPQNLYRIMRVQGGQMVPRSPAEIKEISADDWPPYRPLCPEVIVDDPKKDVDKPLQPTEAEPENEREIRKILHQRRTNHLAALDRVENKNVLRSLIYRRIKHFVEQGQSLEDYVTLMQAIEQQNAKLKQPLSKYADLISLATHHLLDRALVQVVAADHIQASVHTYWSVLKKEGIDFSAIVGRWQTTNITAPELREKAEQLQRALKSLL